MNLPTVNACHAISLTKIAYLLRAVFRRLITSLLTVTPSVHPLEPPNPNLQAWRIEPPGADTPDNVVSRSELEDV